MRINLGNKRRSEIKNTVLNILERYQDVRLPVPIKKIVKFLNYRLVPYSDFVKRNNLTYEEVIDYFRTDDACSEYEKNSNMYVIYFNDIDKSKLENHRVRWNIAHELGHIALEHHKNQKSRLFRNLLNVNEYNLLEEEADAFASYILVPYIILNFQNIKSFYDIARICKISKTAAKYRFTDFNLWESRVKYRNSGYTLEVYDKKIFELYNASKSNKEKIFCLKCGTLTRNNNYCHICGNKTKVYRKEGVTMIYDGVELDENKRAKICPVCNNQQIGSEDTFCKICGFKLYNECSNIYEESGFKESICSRGSKLDGNARYCPYCGGKTSFFINRLLSKWKDDDYTSDEELPF